MDVNWPSCNTQMYVEERECTKMTGNSSQKNQTLDKIGSPVWACKVWEGQAHSREKNVFKNEQFFKGKTMFINKKVCTYPVMLSCWNQDVDLEFGCFQLSYFCFLGPKNASQHWHLCLLIYST